ncbi:hypothetical protein FACHB389_01730 [Nostoc calcicola FACHB-389]|nr:DUF416 family protein [Nostoc calcicola FACHB-3891]OKH42399.1 hypothetical protein FACHB389_01730 [Nostoc calcicola FACHB-389]
MNLKYGEFDILEQELESLPPMHRVAFAAACCERLFPNYGIFLREIKEQGWNEKDPIREALDEIWEFLAGKKIDAARFRELLSNCEEYPYKYENEETPEGQRGAWIVCETIELCLEQIPQEIILVAKEIDETLFLYIDYLKCEPEDKNLQDIPHEQLLQLEICLDPSVQQTISVAKEIDETLFEYIDYLRCESEDEYSEDISHEELLEIVANHPFTVREMAKQSEDLRRLRETPTLTPEFLQWLRTSSENGGKSLLDLS